MSKTEYECMAMLTGGCSRGRRCCKGCPDAEDWGCQWVCKDAERTHCDDRAVVKGDN